MFELSARLPRKWHERLRSRAGTREFSYEYEYGYGAVKHQHFVGTGYFDDVTQIVAGGAASITALEGSTELEPFVGIGPPIGINQQADVLSGGPIRGHGPLVSSPSGPDKTAEPEETTSSIK